MKYLIKFGSEITIKSDGVRKQCIKRLKTNILKHLDYNEIDAKCSGNWDRLILEVSDLEDSQKIKNILRCIPGIGHFCLVQEFHFDIHISNEEFFHNLFQEVKNIYAEYLQGKSFVVRARRHGKHNFRSLDVERELGRLLLVGSMDTKVDLKNPDIIIRIDIKNDTYYIIEEKIQGLGGYPVGFQDTLLSLISGGFDSGVSSQMMMRRGCQVDFLFFNLGGTAHELGVKHIAHYLWSNFSVSYKRARFLSVPFDGVVKEILTKVDHRYRAIILKRCMLRVASKIVHRHYHAMVKGDSIGQVSSQTLANLHVVDQASDVLVLRPLIGMNKQDIVNISKNIGTYEFSSSMPEYCGVISDKPSVGANINDVVHEEENISSSILDEAFEAIHDEKISHMDFSKTQNTIEEVKKPGDAIIVDIRETSRVERSPLSHKGYSESIHIPFYEINTRFEKLDQSKQYLLYCDKGILSHLHALYLAEKGFFNIKVFRP